MSSTTPFDQSFKLLADADPKALLRSLGALPPEEPVTILTPPRELHTPSRIPDLLYEVRSASGRRLVHIEAQTRYRSSLSDRVLEYAALAWLQHRMPVASYVLLLTARDCPKSLASDAETEAGGLRMRYGHIKLWEVAPDQALASNRPNLLPFVPLMRGNESTLRLAAQRLRRITNEAVRRELMLRFVMMGSLRYDKQVLLELVGGRMLAEDDDLLAESGYYQYILEKGMKKGIEKGIEQGIEQGVEKGESRLLSRLLERRFGPLPTWALEKIQAARVDALEAWGLRVVEAHEPSLEELLATPP